MTPSPSRAAARLTIFLATIAVLLPLYLVAFPFGRRARRLFARPFFRTCVRLTGLTVRLAGRRPAPGTFFVANHASYLDIPVLAAATDGVFVAKAEVRGWPLFGFLARIARTVFVSRQAANVARERLAIAQRLADGDSVFLFPEGSSSDGGGVLPFRPGLLSAVKADPALSVPVQPVSIVYGPADGDRPAAAQDERDAFAWYGDMELAPHLWRLFGRRRGLTVLVRFHAPCPSDAFADARALSAWAEEIVSAGVRDGLLAAPGRCGSADQPASTCESPVPATPSS